VLSEKKTSSRISLPKTWGAFHSTQFRKFHVPNGTVHSGGRQATTGNTSAVRRVQRVWLLFLLAGYKRAVLGTTILTNGKGHFGSTDRDNRPGQSGPPSRLVPNIPVGPNRNGPFHLMYQPKFPECWVEWKAPMGSNV